MYSPTFFEMLSAYTVAERVTNAERQRMASARRPDAPSTVRTSHLTLSAVHTRTLLLLVSMLRVGAHVIFDAIRIRSDQNRTA
jgi:hypothetical protein